MCVEIFNNGIIMNESLCIAQMIATEHKTFVPIGCCRLELVSYYFHFLFLMCKLFHPKCSFYLV